MSYCTRIAAIMLGFGLAIAPAGLAHASTLGGNAGPGTWTYNFNLGGGVSFEMTMDKAFGVLGGNITEFHWTGVPDGFVNDFNLVTSGNVTYQHGPDGNLPPDGGFDQEIVLQYDAGVGDDSTTLDYTFLEPTSFWQNTGSNLAFTTGDGEFVNDLEHWVGSPTVADNLFFGELGEGANFATYNNVPVPSLALDPPCSSCFIDITFTPAVLTATPEPSTFTLLGTGVAAVFGVYRRRRSK
jgi:PEP-CTERM motif